MATTEARGRITQLLGSERAAWTRRASGLDPANPVVVLDGELDDEAGATAALAAAREQLGDDGELIVAVPCARNLRRLAAEIAGEPLGDRRAAHTRRSLLDLLEAGGWDVRALEVNRDPAITWIPLPLRGRRNVVHGDLILRDQTAADVEELTAGALIAIARPARPDPPALSVVVAVRDELDLTRACLERLLAEPPSAPFELIVVDDGSRDGTAEYLAGLGAQVRVTTNRISRGFAVAINRGTRLARGDVVIVLHNDALPEPGALDLLAETMRTRPEVGAAGPKLVGRDGRISCAGLAYGPELLPYPFHRGMPAGFAAANRRREMPGLPSACLALRRRWLVEAGGFDEAFGMFEDADLCLRLQARGREILYCPEAVVAHVEGGTPGPRTLLDDAAYMLGKWEGELRVDDVELAGRDDLDVRLVRARGWHMPRRGRTDPGADAPLPVLLSGQAFGHSGYANETRTYAKALERAGVLVRLNPFGWPQRPREGGIEYSWPLATAELPREFAHLCTFVAIQLLPHPRAALNVGRTMWETDRVPDDRLEMCEQMNELWVPAQQQLEVFAASGFPRERLAVLPQTFDSELYDDPMPARIEGAQGFVFLSVFMWNRRKGWDVLVRAFVEEFEPDEDVTLVLGYRNFAQSSDEQSHAELRELIARETGRSITSCPRIVMLPLDLTDAAIASLYAAADAFVLPTRGEGWGRPLMEAMASGLPTVATRWGGSTEFMTDESSYLIDYELVDVHEGGWKEFSEFRGQRWANPSIDHLRETMRHVFTDRDESRARGERAREHIYATCGPEVVGRQIVEMIAERVG